MVTRLGIAILGVTGTLLLVGVGLGMLFAPSTFRFVFYIEADLLSHGRSIVGYDPARFGLFAWLHFGCAALWGGLCLGAYVTLPAQNRRIDAALRARLQPMAHGAPLEPRQGDDG